MVGITWCPAVNAGNVPPISLVIAPLSTGNGVGGLKPPEPETPIPGNGEHHDPGFAVRSQSALGPRQVQRPGEKGYATIGHGQRGIRGCPETGCGGVLIEKCGSIRIIEIKGWQTHQTDRGQKAVATMS